MWACVINPLSSKCCHQEQQNSSRKKWIGTEKPSATTRISRGFWQGSSVLNILNLCSLLFHWKPSFTNDFLPADIYLLSYLSQAGLLSEQGFYRLHQCVLMLKLRFYSQIQPKLPKYNLDFGAINKCRHVRSGKCWIRVRVVILHPSPHLTSLRLWSGPIWDLSWSGSQCQWPGSVGSWTLSQTCSPHCE